MNKRTKVAVVLAILLAASANAQTKNILDLAAYGTPLQIQAAIVDKWSVEDQNSLGWTPLMVAARYNPNPEVITTLLKAGANINFRDRRGITPLMVATWGNKNPEVIITLLRAGANAKTRDDFMGQTAFDWAKDNEKLKGTAALKQLEEACK